MDSSVDSLVVDMLEPSASSLDSSPADSGSCLSTSASTLPRTPSIKFAPLPQLARRKRRSSVPLGVAARAQLMRRRPGGGAGPEPAGPRQPASEREVEEPFAALGLGKVVRGVWRRVAKRGPGAERGVLVVGDAVDEHILGDFDEMDLEDSEAGEPVDESAHGRVGDCDEMDFVEEEEEVEEDEEEEEAEAEEGEAEEGVAVKFREDISQTETVRDDSAYSWNTLTRPTGNETQPQAGLGG